MSSPGAGDAARTAGLHRVFVELADTGGDDHDEVGPLQTLVETCVALVGAIAGGLLMADPDGRLRLLASCGDCADFVELAQLGAQQGPCLASFRSGLAVSVPDVAAERERWPDFAAAAAAHGIRSAHSTPMRLRNRVIGAVDLLCGDEPVDPVDAAIARALAEVATIGVLQRRALMEARALAAQLQTALDTRVVIEQAKGVLVATAGVSAADAFELLRAFARRTRTPLRALAAGLVEREVDPQALRARG